MSAARITSLTLIRLLHENGGVCHLQNSTRNGTSSVWETVQEWLPALLQQLPAVRQDADDEDRNDKGMEP